MYPYPIAYGGYSMPCYYGCPMMARLEDEDEYYDREMENGEPPFPGSMQMPGQMGPMPLYPPAVPMQPAAPMQPGAMQPPMPMQPIITPQPGTMDQDAFTTVLKQIQADAPDMLNALLTIGTSIDTLRQLILRIIEAAEREENK